MIPAGSRVVLASGNAHKAEELMDLLERHWELELQSTHGVESIEETGTTFEANALLKARHAAAVTGLPAMADDSGLVVDALDGAPGVRSARFAGEDATDEANWKLLLERLDGVPAAERTARFVCTLAIVQSADDPDPLIVEGGWEGSIAEAPEGEHGFGYDPVFIDADTGNTAASMPAAEKNARSHRGRAVVNLRAALGLAGD